MWEKSTRGYNIVANPTHSPSPPIPLHTCKHMKEQKCAFLHFSTLSVWNIRRTSRPSGGPTGGPTDQQADQQTNRRTNKPTGGMTDGQSLLNSVTNPRLKTSTLLPSPSSSPLFILSRKITRAQMNMSKTERQEASRAFFCPTFLSLLRVLTSDAFWAAAFMADDL